MPLIGILWPCMAKCSDGCQGKKAERQFFKARFFLSEKNFYWALSRHINLKAPAVSCTTTHTSVGLHGMFRMFVPKKTGTQAESIFSSISILRFLQKFGSIQLLWQLFGNLYGSVGLTDIPNWSWRIEKPWITIHIVIWNLAFWRIMCGKWMRLWRLFNFLLSSFFEIMKKVAV